jgi:hypothetical protein
MAKQLNLGWKMSFIAENQHLIYRSQTIVKATWSNLEVHWVCSDQFLELLLTGEQWEIQRIISLVCRVVVMRQCDNENTTVV